MIRVSALRQVSLATLILVSVGLTGCGWLWNTPQQPIEPPTESSVVEEPSSKLAELVTGNTRFALSLYQIIFTKSERAKNENLFYSPYSISLALAMTYAGARGETELQMAQTLHFTLPQEHLHPTFRALDLELANRGKEIEGGFQLSVANALWGQTGHPFLPEFLNILAQNYGAHLRQLDFMAAPEDSRLAINSWVSDQTQDKIQDLLPPGSIDSSTRLVLTNAIYFKAAWAHPFMEDQTREGTFHLLDGNQVTLPMMEQTGRFRYSEGDGYQAVELPYVDGKLAMVVLLPKSLEEFESSLSVERLHAILSDLALQSVQLTMPKFTYESSFNVKEALSALGMPIAFSEAADFSGMDGARELFIDEVYHKAFISVNEQGTEAAAATAVAMVPSMIEPTVEVTIDRPFIFLIRDIETGAILFIGRVVDLRT